MKIYYMKKYSINAALLSFMAMSLSSCEIVGEIFKTGMWVGVVLVVLVIFLIFYFLNKGKGNP
ncbi:MAG: hypothetical protein JWO32_1941 [Bacteroidetes bacterium]|nr:hypothetical protein [Bacteroidota bacterium]